MNANITTRNKQEIDWESVHKQSPLQRYFCPQAHMERKKNKNREKETAAAATVFRDFLWLPLVQCVCRQEV